MASYAKKRLSRYFNLVFGAPLVCILLTSPAQAEQKSPTVQLNQQLKLKSNLAAKVKNLPYSIAATTTGAANIQHTLNISGVDWSCKGNLCTTNVKYPGDGVTLCRQLASKVGPVRSFRMTRQPPTLVRIKGYPLSAQKIALCNQGLMQAKTDKADIKARGADKKIVQNVPVVSPSANRAKEIGEASDRMKQVKQLQDLQRMGTPLDRATGSGAAGRQDCSQAADRAKCLRDNMNAGQAPASTPGNGMRDCIRGANPQNCLNGGGGKRPGTLSAGPGDPRDQIGDPRSVAAGDSGDDEPDGVWIRGGSHTERRGEHGRTEYKSEYRHNADGTTDTVYVSTTYREREDGPDLVLYERVTETKRNAQTEVVETHSHPSNLDDLYQMRSPDPGTPPDSDASGPAGQAAPDSASGGAADNCNRDLVTGKCRNPQPDAKGATSQPGAANENDRGILGRNAPQTDVGAAINCGDANNDACNRAGSNLNNGAKPIDHKDPGPTPGNGPH